MTTYHFLRLRLSCGCTVIGRYPTKPLDSTDRQERGARMICPSGLGHGWQFIKSNPEPATIAEREKLTIENEAKQ